MKLNRQILASALLMLFGIVLVADLHILGHDDADANDTECSICDFTSEHNNDDFTPSEIIGSYDVVQIPADVVRTTYVDRYFKVSIAYSFLNKAPPVA